MLHRVLSYLRTVPTAGAEHSPSPPPGDAALDCLARTAPRDARAHYYLRLGDTAAAAGDVARALGHYGRAVDDHLESARYGPAAALCRTMVRLAPEAVRPRATLAFLLLGNGPAEEAERALDDYVRAARAAGKGELAVNRLRGMERATGDPTLRRAIGNHLIEFGDALGVDRIFAGLRGEREGHAAPRPDPREQWAVLLRTSVIGDRPPELRSFEVHRRSH